jgi:16S rRNA processing protein RimM
MTSPTRRLEVGRVGRAHGLRGEVSVSFTSNRSERTMPGALLYAGEQRLTVASARPHQGRWIVRFRGIEDRTAAEALHGTMLTADPLPLRRRAGPDGPAEVWVHEVVGAAVEDGTGRSLGTVVAVEANPAHDLLVLDGGGLVPVVFVRSYEEGRVVVDIPDGLLEL